MAAEGNNAVYWVCPISSREDPPLCSRGDEPDGSYVAIQRLVSESPVLPDSEIETIFEAFVTATGECLWRRVSVWSGPNSPQQRTIHASFILPTANDNSEGKAEFFLKQPNNDKDSKALSLLDQPSFLCWAAFREYPKHKLLCVLADPLTLCIWDVYPQTDQVCVKGEGHSQNLPFRCRGVYPVGESNGIILQRQDDPEDLAAFQYSDMDIDKGAGANKDDDNDFILAMPGTTCSSHPNNTSFNSGGQQRTPASMPTPRSAYTATSTEVPSLYTLEHPLQEVLPVSHWSESTALVTDAFEKVIHADTLKWNSINSDDEKKHQHQQPIIVTYNTIHKRHAIWAVKAAPEPIVEPFLWRRSRDRTNARKWDNHISMMEQDLEDMELLGFEPPHLHQEGPTRDEALADALGVVRKTPRKAGESSTRGRGRAIEPRTSRSTWTEAGLTNTSGFLHASTRSAKESFAETELSFTESATQPLNFRPQASLRPTIAIDCLFEESEESEPADNILLASNLEGTGLLLLGLLCPSSSEGCHVEKTLRLYSITPSSLGNNPGKEATRTPAAKETPAQGYPVKMLRSLSCLDATPIQTLRRAPYGGNETGRPHTTEILVLQRGSMDEHCSLALYRGQCHVVDCALLGMPSITGLLNPVRGNVDFVVEREGDVRSLIRGCISLEIESNALAMKAITAIESSLANISTESKASALQFALKFKADCCRLHQFLRKDQDRTNARLKDSWATVTTVLHAVFDYIYFGSVPGSNSGSAPSQGTYSAQKSPWANLLNSSYHAKFACGDLGALLPGSSGITASENEAATFEKEENLPPSFELSALGCLQPGTSITGHIFDTLHFLYEDLKLSPDPRRIDDLRSIGSFLVTTCFKLDQMENRHVLRKFLNHYRHDLGAAWVDRIGTQRLKRASLLELVQEPPAPTSLDSPPCILTWLEAKVRNDVDTTSIYDRVDLSKVNAVCAKTRLLLQIFNIMFCLEEDDQRDMKVVSALCEAGFFRAERVRDDLPTGAAIPILEALHRCGDKLGQADVPGWGADEYNLIRRSDLGHHHDCEPSSVNPRRVSNTTLSKSIPLVEDTDQDGIQPLQTSSAMLFPADNRIKEAGRLLRSSRPCPLSVHRSVEVSDHEYERLKQIKLLLLCRRALAVPVGRGMLTIGNFSAPPAEPLPVPELCLAGSVAPTNTNLALDVSDCQNGFLNWPEFHNGVAAGLRLPAAGEDGESSPKISRSWIVYNRPPQNPDSQSQQQTNNGQRSSWRTKIHAHGGLLLALGLRGHLSALEMTDIYDYLTQGQVTLTCGVLLGMAANKRGTSDISVSKMLCLHLPSLMPQQFSAIDVASSVQTAAVTGTGLLFQGSSHRLFTEFLLNEIGRRPDSDVMSDRESYTLSCAIALGMINIGKGDRIGNGHHAGFEGEGLSDLRLGERLCRYVSSGVDENEVRRIKEGNDRLNYQVALNSGEQERCCCIFEGATINVDVTAAGATLALGLVFCRTGNQSIASVIALPDTHTLLEYVRPDFLALRVVAQSLIMWDSVLPSKDWIKMQMPVVVGEAYEKMKEKAASTMAMASVGDMLDDDDGASSQMEIGNGHGNGAEVPNSNSNRVSGQERHHIQSEDYDCQVVRQIYVHVLAGACFALGLRFAGTGNKMAADAIFERVLELQTLRDVNDSVSQALRPEPQILETCLGCCAIALAMVNAGTGDLETLKLLKILRWRCDEEVKYGAHMSFGMAIGLLFLGGGSYTLGRDPEDVAALIAAFFPRFPYSSTDNQYHLQALRHLYALAVKRRDIRFADVDTGEIVPVPIEIRYGSHDANPLHLTAPCLVPNGDGIVEAQIVSHDFYPLKFRLTEDAFGRTLFVKRRTTFPSPGRGIDDQLSLQVCQHVGNLQEYLQGKPDMLALVTYLFGLSNTCSTTLSQQGVSMDGFYTCLLPECLSNHSDMAFPLYLRLWGSIAALEDKCFSSSKLLLWDLHLIRASLSSDPRPLLSPEKLAYLGEIVERVSSTS
ncbi:promoting complex subunit 1 [Seminavis robusta]|uniref:Promoting complex subunit 1 n=1 Tax=Seminavis robusta TaxID=568900 RepID=A0A9N8DNR6_9STRA|nr:promoting complex subunit 1 [Seminavis robusta]|eukprot:Sro182_g079230.1 promoting complex subunit 1 (1997) ;mRNA; f:4080-10236